MTVFALDQSFSLSGLDDGREVSTCLKALSCSWIHCCRVCEKMEGRREGGCVCVCACVPQYQLCTSTSVSRPLSSVSAHCTASLVAMDYIIQFYTKRYNISAKIFLTSFGSFTLL